MLDSLPRPVRPGSDEALIEPTPRKVPGAVRRRLLFGGPVHQMGWLFGGFGFVFAWFFVGDSELWTHMVFSGQLVESQGRVTAVERTGASENENDIYAVHYAYEWNGANHEGVSYAFHGNAQPGEPVPVEVAASRPEVSRIVGLRYRKFSALVSFVLLFPLIGFGMVVYTLGRGLRNIRLLAHGLPARGTLVEKRTTNVRINEAPVYELTFRYRDRDDREQQGSIRTLHTAPMEDEAQERLLYDPKRPRHIVLLDDLGRDVRVDERGRLVAERGSFAVTLVPALISAAILAVMLF